MRPSGKFTRDVFGGNLIKVFINSKTIVTLVRKGQWITRLHISTDKKENLF